MDIGEGAAFRRPAGPPRSTGTARRSVRACASGPPGRLPRPPASRPSLFQHLLGFWRGRPGEARLLLGMGALFALIFFLPMGQPRFENAVLEGLHLTRWYAREHVILCLLPAFVIAGALAVYISQGAVMRHLGPRAP